MNAKGLIICVCVVVAVTVLLAIRISFPTQLASNDKIASSVYPTSRDSSYARPASLAPEALSAIWDPSSKGKDIEFRLSLIHQVNANSLSLSDCSALMEFAKGSSLEADSPSGLYLALKNDVLKALSLQDFYLKTLKEELEGIVRSSAYGSGLRDYAMQYLATIQEAHGSDAISVHWEIIAGMDENLAAGAMIELLSLNRRKPLSLREILMLKTAAMKGIEDGKCDLIRSAGIQVCGELKVAEAEPYAWEIASSEASSVSLRIAAIGALGELRTTMPGASEFLKQISKTGSQRLRLPAMVALNKIRN